MIIVLKDNCSYHYLNATIGKPMYARAITCLGKTYGCEILGQELINNGAEGNRYNSVYPYTFLVESFEILVE